MAKRTDRLWRNRLKARRATYPFPKFQRECALLTEDLLFGEIYIAENLVNGKQYCGKTEFCAEYRWSAVSGSHIEQINRGCNDYFHKALRKYGSAEQFYLDGFKVTVIFHARSENELNQMEKQVIAERDLMNPTKGYNSREGGKSGSPSEDVKKKIGESNKANWNSLTETEREERLDNGVKKAIQISAETREQAVWHGMSEEAQERFREEARDRQKKKIANMTEDELEKHLSNLTPASPEQMREIGAEYIHRLKTDSDEMMKFRAAVRFAKNPIDPKTDISKFFSEK